jgi:hypothetical protein
MSGQVVRVTESPYHIRERLGHLQVLSSCRVYAARVGVIAGDADLADKETAL